MPVRCQQRSLSSPSPRAHHPFVGIPRRTAMAMIQIRKSTPVLIVDAIEPSLPFWQERLGLERPVEVPDGDRLGFVILTNGAIEIMYQTSALLAKDSSAYGVAFDNDKTLLFVEVDDIDALA